MLFSIERKAQNQIYVGWFLIEQNPSHNTRGANAKLVIIFRGISIFQYNLNNFIKTYCPILEGPS